MKQPKRNLFYSTIWPNISAKKTEHHIIITLILNLFNYNWLQRFILQNRIERKEKNVLCLRTNKFNFDQILEVYARDSQKHCVRLQCTDAKGNQVLLCVRRCALRKTEADDSSSLAETISNAVWKLSHSEWKRITQSRQSTAAHHMKTPTPPPPPSLHTTPASLILASSAFWSFNEPCSSLFFVQNGTQLSEKRAAG